MRKILYIFCLIFTLFKVSPVLADFEYKISDAIAPFFDEQKTIEHYSNIPFYQLDTDVSPFVDMKQFENIKVKFREYIKNIKEAGYTYITLDDINHLIL